MIQNHRVIGIILAAGSGSRMKSNQNKIFIKLNKKPIIAHTIEVFENAKSVDDIILVGKVDEIEKLEIDIVKHYGYKKIRKIVAGGLERSNSVFKALEFIENIDENCLVSIHDGARPFITEKLINKTLIESIKHDGSIVGVYSKDTIKEVNNLIVKRTLPRENLINVQTPQSFRYEIIKKAYKECLKKELKVTDDSMMVESLGGSVKIVIGDYENIKITTPEDLILAEGILYRKLEARK